MTRRIRQEEEGSVDEDLVYNPGAAEGVSLDRVVLYLYIDLIRQ